MPDLFQHKPLEQPDKQIRLFFLEEHYEPTSCDPSSNKSPTTTELKRRICGRVQNFSLEDHPKYVALSYTWGDAKDTGQIVVDGALFEVTANLLAVLEVLVGLKELRGRPLWIDAICINQNDKDEKNSQVPLMGSIYSRATEVFAWIGPEADGSADALGALDEYGDWWLKLREQLGDNRQSIWETWALTMIKGDYDALKRLLGPSLEGPTPQTLKVFERPWWHRVWVIQEVTLARAASVMCGTRFVSWKNIMEAVYFLRDFQSQLLIDGPWSGMKDLYSPIEHFFVLWDKWGRRQLSAQAELQERSGDSRGPSEALRMPELSLEEVVEYLMSLDDDIQASDEKDRVYAFLAFLSPKDRALLDVDYSENTKFSDVMTTITQIMFQRHGPRILSLRQSLSPESQGLPSWYIDWTRIQRELAMYDPTYASDFAAAGKGCWSPQTCQVRGYPTQLPLDGIQISSVGKLALFDFDVSLSKNPRKTEAGCTAEIESLSCWVEMMLGLLKSSPDNSLSHGACKSASKADLCLVPTAGDQICRWTMRNDEVYKIFPGSQVGLERRLQVTHRPFEAEYRVVTGLEMDDLLNLDNEGRFNKEFRRHWNLYDRFEVLMGERVPEELVEIRKVTLSGARDALRSAGHNPDEMNLSSATESATRKFVWEYWRRIRLNGHKGFVTSDGRAGLGPRAMKTSDLVVIFKGCEFPFVIRPRCEEKKEYELVGACYVDGIMMGEALEENPFFEQMFLV